MGLFDIWRKPSTRDSTVTVVYICKHTGEGGGAEELLRCPIRSYKEIGGNELDRIVSSVSISVSVHIIERGSSQVC